MSGGGSKSSGKLPKELRAPFKSLGASGEQLIGDINRTPSFSGRTANYRRAVLNNRLGTIGDTGLDRGLLDTTFQTGGFTPFTADDQAAFSAARGLSGSDSALGSALGRYKNNTGIDALQGIRVNDQRRNALSALEGYNPDALRGFSPEALEGLSFDQLEATARGDFLDVANNPFLSDALANAQRRTTESFTRDVQPALAAQFGGGFGLTGSSSINAQRRAAEDLSRALSEQATSTLAGQYNIERGLQEQAAGQLGQLGLGRAQGIDQLGFQRASEIDQLGLSQAGQLGDLGLGFTNAAISRGSNLADAELRQAQGIAQVGNDRRAQELQRIGLLNNIGQQQRQSALDFYNAQERLHNAPIDDRISRFQGVNSILGGFPGQQPTTGQGSRASGILGGIGVGAGAGTAIGGPFGGLIGGIGGGILGAF